MSEDSTTPGGPVQECRTCRKDFTGLLSNHNCKGVPEPKPTTTPTQMYEKRKYKLHMVPQELVLRQLMGEVTITSFLPRSCLADIGYKIDTQGLAILVCHESYEPVPLDSIPEIVPITYTEVV